jgi:hypothetical protein
VGVNPTQAILELHDLDLLLELARDPASRARLGRLGFTFDGVPALERERLKLLGAVDRRWVSNYERSLGRYGRGINLVRDRVCQGCFVTLPTSATAPAGESRIHMCENCGRLLYWR